MPSSQREADMTVLLHLLGYFWHTPVSQHWPPQMGHICGRRIRRSKAASADSLASLIVGLTPLSVWSIAPNRFVISVSQTICGFCGLWMRTRHTPPRRGSYMMTEIVEAPVERQTRLVAGVKLIPEHIGLEFPVLQHLCPPIRRCDVLFIAAEYWFGLFHADTPGRLAGLYATQ